jgi:hypothetical protein
MKNLFPSFSQVQQTRKDQWKENKHVGNDNLLLIYATWSIKSEPRIIYLHHDDHDQQQHSISE